MEGRGGGREAHSLTHAVIIEQLFTAWTEASNFYCSKELFNVHSMDASHATGKLFSNMNHGNLTRGANIGNQSRSSWTLSLVHDPSFQCVAGGERRVGLRSGSGAERGEGGGVGGWGEVWRGMLITRCKGKYNQQTSLTKQVHLLNYFCGCDSNPPPLPHHPNQPHKEIKNKQTNKKQPIIFY